LTKDTKQQYLSTDKGAIMINEFGERLRSARKMAGLSMEALAQATGALVSKQAISKYEKGHINPQALHYCP
jgi:predicted transcriptional regulator